MNYWNLCMKNFFTAEYFNLVPINNMDFFLSGILRKVYMQK